MSHSVVMSGLVPGIHVDGWVKPGHDDDEAGASYDQSP
jgi:hypothetical protein